MKSKKLNTANKALLTLGTVCLIGLSNCGNQDNATSSLSEDTSTSGTAASAVGGALSGSSSSGTLALRSQKTDWLANLQRTLNFIPEVNASGTPCATFKTTSGSGCTAISDTLFLTYSDCSFPNSGASWTGVQALTAPSAVTCGTFPIASNESGTLYRQFVTASGSSTAGSATVVTPNGTTVTIDNATSNLENFDGDAIANTVSSAYGTAVTFLSGARTAIDIAEHISAEAASGTPLYNHSVTGMLSVTETAGSSTRTVSGDIKVYHNILRVVGTSAFNSVEHENGCCYPISGTITTTFAAGSSVTPTIAGSAYVGKSESLTFTGCGTATFVDINGKNDNVTLNHCI